TEAADPRPEGRDECGKHAAADDGARDATEYNELKRHVPQTDQGSADSGGAIPPGAPKGSAKRPRPASIADGMLTVEDHLEIVLRGIGPLEPYEQPLVEALNLPLVDDVFAEHDIP